jgi:hypothetical protein
MKPFDPTTLYYFFSTLSQVVATTTALIAVLVHFRISALRDFLIGDGESVLIRKKNNESGYELLTDKNKTQLQDSVNRKDILGIKGILKELAKLETEKNEVEKKVNQDHHGFQWLFGYYCKTEQQIYDMSNVSKLAFIFALITALYSIFAILFIEASQCSLFYQIVLIGLNIILLLICSCYLIRGFLLAFKNFTNRFE